MSNFSFEQFKIQLQPAADVIAGSKLDQSLQEKLNKIFHPQSKAFKAIEAACHEGIKNNQLCQHEAGGIEYGRVFKASSDLAGCSIDLVKMTDVIGPHHRHPLGEIDLIMPISNTAQFDGSGAGWLVYPPGSSHCPTVTDGQALVLYFLPNGEIEFS